MRYHLKFQRLHAVDYDPDAETTAIGTVSDSSECFPNNQSLSMGYDCRLRTSNNGQNERWGSSSDECISYEI